MDIVYLRRWLPPSEDPRSLVVDQNGTVWVGTGDIGLLRFDGEEWDILTSEDGLPGDTFGTLFVDDDGNLWAVSDQGLTMYDEASWHTFTGEYGPASIYVSSITQAPDGAMWFGSSAGATRFDGSTW